ncbi:MAG: septum site-determining protein MinC [Syntrophomonadaceae bacterium]|nr:septum site-determining protein MinC [Syntrophomonadaceae bacterium]MDD3022271.1 septum site-determining protein MinC [Syntrophomonadaceae bacterium]
MQSCNTFAEMKDQLNAQLKSVGDFWLGGTVSIDTGYQVLSNKQLEEIQSILSRHGLNLQSNNSIVSKELTDSDNEISPFEQLPFYEDTMLICKSLRSGQRIVAEGNVVILGDVNPGAEIIAGGNIIIMGSLRGMVHAGAYGDDTALVSAYRLNPTQLRIGSHITRSPDGELIMIECPELARIRGGKVCIEKLKI